METIAVLLLMVLCLVVLVGFLVLSYKLLNKVREEEKASRQGNVPERQLHPKLKQQDKNK